MLYVVKVLEEGRARPEEKGFTISSHNGQILVGQFRGDKSNDDMFLFVLTRSY